jgi:hypothetical protein
MIPRPNHPPCSLRFRQKLDPSHQTAIVSSRPFPLLRSPASRLNRTSIRILESREMDSRYLQPYRLRRPSRHLNGQAAVVPLHPAQTLGASTNALNRLPLRPIEGTQIRPPRRIRHQVHLSLQTSLICSRPLLLLPRTHLLQPIRLSSRQRPHLKLRRPQLPQTTNALRPPVGAGRPSGVDTVPNDDSFHRLRNRSLRRHLRTGNLLYRSSCRSPGLTHQRPHQKRQRDPQTAINPTNPQHLTVRSATTLRSTRRGSGRSRTRRCPVPTRRTRSPPRFSPVPFAHPGISLQHPVRIINLLEFVLRLLPQPRIAPKAIWMPHLHQIAIGFFDLDSSCAGPQCQNLKCLIRQQGVPPHPSIANRREPRRSPHHTLPLQTPERPKLGKLPLPQHPAT